MKALVDSVIAISVCLYAISLLMPVTCCFWDQQKVHGYHALIMGWSFLPGIGGLSWLANIFVITAWLTFSIKKRAPIALGLSAVASGLALTGIIAASSGDRELLIGAYLWLTGILVTLLAYIIEFAYPRHRSRML